MTDRTARLTWAQLFSPLLQLQHLLQRWLWGWWLLLLLGYLGSGLHTIQPDEVGMVLRFGRLVDSGTPQAVHPPGLLWVLPAPFDEVLRVPVQKVNEVDVRGLHVTAFQSEGQPLTFLNSSTLDSEKVGYALTGDGNVVHAFFVARYQISDPVQAVLEHHDVESLLQLAVQRAAVREIGARAVDAVLTDGRQDLLEAIEQGTQAMLQQQNAGIELRGIELSALSPPHQVRADFSAVQSADIDAKTSLQEAEEYRATQLPKARSARNTALQQAKAEAATLRSEARAAAASFEKLLAVNQRDPVVLRERLYREGVERFLSDAGKLKFVPAPSGARYQQGFRLSLPEQK